MSVNLMSMVFNCNMPNLATDDGKSVPDTTAKSVLLALADNANDEGEGSYPGVITLCHKTNYSTSTVCNALNALRHNKFTFLVGKSKRDTNNYTISVAEILKFQWPKREDFSHRNDTVSATEMNPSLSIQNPSIKNKILKSADQTVDRILKMEKESKGKSYTKLPEMFIPYGKAFCESTSIEYTKRLSMDWISTFSDWLTAGYTPEMIPQAVKECVEKGMPANSPRSIEWKMKDIKVRAFVKAQQRANLEQDQTPSVIPASWQAIYDEGAKVPA